MARRPDSFLPLNGADNGPHLVSAAGLAIALWPVTRTAPASQSGPAHPLDPQRGLGVQHTGGGEHGEDPRVLRGQLTGASTHRVDDEQHDDEELHDEDGAEQSGG